MMASAMALLSIPWQVANEGAVQSSRRLERECQRNIELNV
jgi:hypothetical protein